MITGSDRRPSLFGGATMSACTVLVLVLVLVLAACSTGSGTPATAAVDKTAGPTATTPATTAPAATEATTRRNGDETDIEVLAATMAAGATGDAQWVDVFATVRARSWLTARYPGRYELELLFAPAWIAVPAANQAEQIELGLYIDEPLPRLVSVSHTRDLGELVELEVVVDVGDADVRREADDTVVTVLAGATTRGLYLLGREEPDGPWRIHSITELVVPDGPTAEEPSS